MKYIVRLLLLPFALLAIVPFLITYWMVGDDRTYDKGSTTMSKIQEDAIDPIVKGLLNLAKDRRSE